MDNFWTPGVKLLTQKRFIKIELMIIKCALFDDQSKILVHHELLSFGFFQSLFPLAKVKKITSVKSYFNWCIMITLLVLPICRNWKMFRFQVYSLTTSILPSLPQLVNKFHEKSNFSPWNLHISLFLNIYTYTVVF